MERREMMKGALVGAMSGAIAGAAKAQGLADNRVPLQGPPMAIMPTDPAAVMLGTEPGVLRGEMLYRKLGTTGDTISAIGMGGAHLTRGELKEEAAAVKMVHQAIDRGITFMDNCWDYSNGECERRAGIAFSQGGYRHKVFLMTKIDGRSKELAAAQIDTSLARFKTDHIDLLQHHEIIRFDDPDRVFAAEGAMEAVVAAQKAGKVRHIGFTGHKDPHVHLYMLEVAQRNGFHFDAVQMPLNVMDAHYRSFAHMVVPYAVSQGIGILGMKAFGDGVFMKSNAPISPIEMLQYGLSLPTSVQITGIDSQKVLDQAFTAARTFRPMDRAQIAELLGRSRPYALNGQFELFKTSSHFDGTARHPDYLGPDTSIVQNLGSASAS